MGGDGSCCDGCNGGDYDASFAWAVQEKQYLILEENYRYEMANGTCESQVKGLSQV